MHARALANAMSVAKQRPEFKTLLAEKWPAPNAELTGRRRVDALPAGSSIDSERPAGKVASRWRSGSTTC